MSDNSYRDRFDRVVGDNIARLRRERNRTQREISVVLDIDQGSLSMMERGLRSIKFSQAVKVANYLGIGIDELLRGI